MSRGSIIVIIANPRDMGRGGATPEPDILLLGEGERPKGAKVQRPLEF